MRVDLFGHHFTKHLSVQATYMRPARFVAYNNVNGNAATSQVLTAYAGLTLVWEMPLNARVSAYGEAGGGVTSRSGFEIDGATALESAHYAAGLLGAGLAYHATPKIDVLFGATYSPGRKSFSQPSTRLYTTGIRFHMRPLPAATVEDQPAGGIRVSQKRRSAGLHDEPAELRRQQLLLAEGADFLGRQRRDAARLHARLPAQRVPHQEGVRVRSRRERVATGRATATAKVFRTLSAYPLFRFFLARTEPADLYFSYSLAGPTFISRTTIDGRDTGERFTFQDFMGIGAFFGKARRMNAELGIKHYSNGNIFTRNASIKIPLTLTLGLTF